MIESVLNMPMGRRIHALTLAPLLGVYLLLSVFIWAMLDSLAIQGLENKGNHIISSASTFLQGALISGDEDAAVALIESIAKDEDIVQIKVVKSSSDDRFVEVKGAADSTDDFLVVKRDVSREMMNSSLWETPESQDYQKRLGQVELTLSKHRIHGEVNRAMRNIAIAGILLLALAIILGRLIGNSILRPLQEIASAVVRITKGNYSQALDLQRNDELGALGNDINAMAQVLGQQKMSIDEHLRELVESREEATGLNQRKTNLLISITREYGNPLTAAIGNLQRAVESNSNGESNLYIKKALDHVEYLSELNVDVEQLARFDRTQVKIRKVPLTVDSLLVSCIGAYQDAFEEKNVTIVVDWGAHASLAYETVYSDPTRLRVIMNNLLGSALKSVQEGSGELVIRVFMTRDCDDMSIMIDLMFSASGAGEQRISPMSNQNEHNGIEICNEELTEGDLSDELGIAYQVADSMGGKLSVCSTLGGERSILLQVGVACAVSQDEKAAINENTAKKIMIIEEPHSAQEIAINYLRTKGLCVDRFRSGIEAIQASKLADYVMIFIDSRLPDMSGQDVAKAIRAVTAHSQTPLIAMVDHSNDPDTEDNLDIAFSDQLQKPLTGSLLFQLAEGHLIMNKKILSLVQ